jgi:glycosyltransferase involved in cell wall biosynthesis
MSTYPIASAHCIGYLLQRFTRLPWIAELRDPMVQDNYPPNIWQRRSYSLIEQGIFRRANLVVVTTEGCADLYRERYPFYPPDSVVVIPNGFDPELFPAGAGRSQKHASARPLHVLHSGTLYRNERNPTYLFRALSELRREGHLIDGQENFSFRASGSEGEYSRELQCLGLDKMVKLLPVIPYPAALEEMLNCDACLLLQASNCNQQIPAKIYEYLYSGKPILGLTDPEGDTARMMRNLGMSSIVPLDDTAAIKQAIPRFLDEVRGNRAFVPAPETIEQFSRRNLTSRLARTLSELLSAERQPFCIG